MFTKEWAFASTDALRNDPQGRDASVVIFEAKGHKPRDPECVFKPIGWPHPWIKQENRVI